MQSLLSLWELELSELLKSVGASAVIEGGQTMNPSTEDIVKAIEDVGAERVLILPNNKNIIMAAEQAAEILGIEAAVVPTKTVPKELLLFLHLIQKLTVEENKKNMTNAFAHVKTGQVTFAVRDTSIDGVEIKKDDFMGIAEGKIIISNPSLEVGAHKLAKSIIDEDAEIVTIIYGEDVTEEEANEFACIH